MLFVRIALILFLGGSVLPVYAGELNAKLTMQIELLPSCRINNKKVLNGDSNINIGTFDFGETTSSFSNAIETSLINDNGSGIVIQCSGIHDVKLVFGQGQNDINVPSSFGSNYYHALTNGTDFLAYNLLFGLNKVVIKPNDFFIISDVEQEKIVDVFGQVINNGTRISTGSYTDTIPVIIEF